MGLIRIAFPAWVIVFLLGLTLAGTVGAANTATFTWDTETLGDLSLRLWAARCMPSAGSQDLNVTVYRGSTSVVSTSASVTGTFYKPQGGTDTVNFTNLGDGNYAQTYSFSQNGTYKLALRATDLNYSPGDLNEYVYVQDLNFDIVFTNNGFSVTAGNTGTIQNRVTNSDGNAVTGLIGNIDLNYPNGTLFVNDANIFETGDGNYYYSFTAPSTAGVYSATSTFLCGTSTDSNNQGSFTVNAASSGGSGGSTPGDTSGNTGAGGGGGGGGGSGGASPNVFDARVLEWGFTQPVEVGKSTRVFVVVENNGIIGTAYLIKATISNGQKNEYFDTILTPFIAAGQTARIEFTSPYTTYSSGHHYLAFNIFKPDGSEQIREYVETINVGGILRYDVVATCLEPTTIPGKEISALINLINLGDYFQDMQFSWWVENTNGIKFGEGTFPIALYNQESRSIVRSVFISSDMTPGEYQFRAQLAYETTLIGGACTFNVKIAKDYYHDQLSYVQTVMTELTQIAETKRGRLSPSVFEKLNETKILVGLLENAVENENYADAETLLSDIREVLSLLTRQIIKEEPPGLFDNVNVGQALISTAAMTVVMVTVLLLHPLSAAPAPGTHPPIQGDRFLPPEYWNTASSPTPTHRLPIRKTHSAHTSIPRPRHARPTHLIRKNTPHTHARHPLHRRLTHHLLGLKGIKK